MASTTATRNVFDESVTRNTTERPSTRARGRGSHTATKDESPNTRRGPRTGKGARDEAGAENATLQITVVNGDLTFARQPLLLGHYRSSRLTGTERVINRLLGNAMQAALPLGSYPDLPGTNQIFLNTTVNPDNPWQIPRPEAVIVVGLGEEGKLRAAELVATVRQAVIAWAQRVAEKGEAAPSHVELAATLIGSGGTGVSAGQSAQLIAQGVCEARDRLADQHAGHRPWPRVSHLHLIELYLDRATEAWRALQLQAEAVPGQYTVTETLQPGTGSLRRPLDSGYRGADYDFIAAVTQDSVNGDTSIAYTLDTKRARTEVRAQALQERLVRDVVANASNDTNSDTRIGRSLFNLLVPVEMQPFLGGTTEMLLELDRGTAGIPWELLDTDARRDGDTRPWAIRAKLLRKLRIADFRAQVTDADADSSVLVIGEPACDPNSYLRLPGARDEALAVAKRFAAPGALGEGGTVKALISSEDPEKLGPDALTVINTLLERDWRIVHIAGHGDAPQLIGPKPISPNDPPQQFRDPRGVVLSDGTFLGPREIHTIRPVPELVFVNCCHLAARDANQVLSAPYDRVRFASGVAEELIKIGVRCVIAAGWAVDDDAASAFATTFYDALLGGDRFIDAVTKARIAALNRGSNTWAAYQCYGDPDWTFRRDGGDAQRPEMPPKEKFAGIASSSALIVALETIAVQSRFQHAPAESQKADLLHLESQFAPHWGEIGAVAEAFGAAWSEIGDRAAARKWYEKAVTASDGSASIKATEQLGNVSARVAWESVDAACKYRDKARRGLTESGSGRTTAHQKARTEAQRRLDAAEHALAGAVDAARARINVAIDLFEKLVALHPTMERESLYGSAYKRLAMIEAAAGQTERDVRAVREMKKHYQRAEMLGRETQPLEFSYPALNHMAAELVLNVGRRGWAGLDPDAVAAARASLETKARDDPDFFSILGQTELRLYEALARGELATSRTTLEQEYEELHSRVSSARMWATVYDTARFVLPRYASRASASEKHAAEALLKRLKGLAHT